MKDIPFHYEKGENPTKLYAEMKGNIFNDKNLKQYIAQ